MFATKPRDESRGHHNLAPGKRARKRHSMESPKKPSRGRGEDEERILTQDSATRMSQGVPRNPKQVLKNQSDNPGRVTNWTGPPDHKKLRRQRNNSGEREDPAHRNKKTKGAELRPFKAETDNPRPVAGRIPCHVKGTLPEVTPVMLCQKQKSQSHPREGDDVENLRHPVYKLAPLPGKSDFRKSL